VSAQLLSGRSGVVTGGGDIGAAIADSLARHGARVEVWDSEPKALSTLVGRGHVVRQVDVTDLDAVHRGANASAEAFGVVDFVVNTAAIARFGSVADIEMSAWHDTMSVNLDGVLHACRAFLKHVRRSKGCFVNISSIGGLRGEPEFSAYCASKFAVIGFSQSLAKEEGPHGVRVNCVCPGAVLSTMNTATMENYAKRFGTTVDEVEQLIVDKTALRRLVSPADVAGAVVFLCSDLAASVTGTSISVDGGVS
jgi:NAD(P)-dependent dehydrogenase (short-subunit alcohol dehydrogenase family)